MYGSTYVYFIYIAKNAVRLVIVLFWIILSNVEGTYLTIKRADLSILL